MICLLYKVELYPHYMILCQEQTINNIILLLARNREYTGTESRQHFFSYVDNG